MGNETWEPQPGMLCEDGNGAWHLVGWTPCGSPTGRLTGMGGGCLNIAKPLAPAPSPGGLWDALLQVPGATVLGASVFIELETTVLQITTSPRGAVFINTEWRGLRNTTPPDFSIGVEGDAVYTRWLAENYEARGRDWQREGAIRAYIAQAGWEVQGE